MCSPAKRTSDDDDDDDDDDDVELPIPGCRLTYQGQTVTNAEARLKFALRPQKP